MASLESHLHGIHQCSWGNSSECNFRVHLILASSKKSCQSMLHFSAPLMLWASTSQHLMAKKTHYTTVNCDNKAGIFGEAFRYLFPFSSFCYLIQPVFLIFPHCDAFSFHDALEALIFGKVFFTSFCNAIVIFCCWVLNSWEICTSFPSHSIEILSYCYC